MYHQELNGLAISVIRFRSNKEGGILSTGLYKTYINELLLTLERNRVATHIGTTYVGCPTVADDLALLANCTPDLQLMLDVTNSFANREKYVIHPEKSTIIIRIPKKSTRFEVTDWKLGDKEVKISQTATHLGILRSTRNDMTSNVEDRISCARKTIYSLTGTGLPMDYHLQHVLNYSIHMYFHALFMD
jgi:hypothetical protein